MSAPRRINVVESAKQQVQEILEKLPEGFSEDIQYHITKDSPGYAAALGVQADRAAVSAQQFPNRGRLVPSSATRPCARPDGQPVSENNVLTHHT